MGVAEEEYQYGSGNGGRSCTGLSCLGIIIAVVFLVFYYLVPVFTQNLYTYADLYQPYPDICGWTCCCLGSVGLFVGIVLIFTDDPEKAKRKKLERQLARKRAQQKNKGQ